LRNGVAGLIGSGNRKGPPWPGSGPSDGSGQRGSAELPAPGQKDHARDHVVIALARQALRREAIVAAA
jgi:hypothetical protein